MAKGSSNCLRGQGDRRRGIWRTSSSRQQRGNCHSGAVPDRFHTRYATRAERLVLKGPGSRIARCQPNIQPPGRCAAARRLIRATGRGRPGLDAAPLLRRDVVLHRQHHILDVTQVKSFRPPPPLRGHQECLRASARTSSRRPLRSRPRRTRVWPVRCGRAPASARQCR
jgi:hypothetical protein